jgi:hypothetical protein
MKRRAFLAASCFAGMAPLTRLASAAEGGDPPAKQLFELRLYHLQEGEKSQRFAEFLGQVAVPALNRAGIKPVGIFRKAEEDESEMAGPDLYVLLPHCCFESVVTATAKLLADEEYLKAGSDILDCPMSDPAFLGIESSLSLAFDECPRIEVPTTNEARVFQLRIYQSHSQKKAKKKVEMFNAGGEIALFRKTGLAPVFFGETLVGTKFPNLTYMVGFDDIEAKNANWPVFVNSPEWKELSGKPEYQDTVSKITNIVLRPVAGSQV